MNARTIRDVMAGHGYAEIRCAYTYTLARRLTVRGENITIDAITAVVDVPLDTPLFLDVWLLDRGTVLFPGEEDTIHYTLEGIKDRVLLADDVPRAQADVVVLIAGV